MQNEEPHQGELLVKKGRPPKYNPEDIETYRGVIIRVASNGGHISAICLELGICTDTFQEWKKTHPEFKAIVEESNLHSQSFHEELLLAGALGKIKNFNAKAFEMIMNNKFGYQRSESPVSVGTVNILAGISQEELENRIREKLESLPSAYLEKIKDVNVDG